MRKGSVPEFTVMPGDLNNVGFCRGGTRRYFAFLGLDWQAFLREGISSNALYQLKDAMADKLVESARKTRGI